MREKLIRWSDIRDELMTPQEQADCKKWLNEFAELIDARDTGKITADKYCRLCFELDKKYGLADEEDIDLYLNNDDDLEEDFSGQIVLVGG